MKNAAAPRCFEVSSYAQVSGGAVYYGAQSTADVKFVEHRARVEGGSNLSAAIAAAVEAISVEVGGAKVLRGAAAVIVRERKADGTVRMIVDTRESGWNRVLRVAGRA